MPAEIVAIEHLSLDGVYQAPAAPDEDRRNGFRHGGWSQKHDDDETRGAVGKIMDGGWSMLAGGVTYDDLYEAWRVRQPEAPMAKALTGVTKFLVTRQVGRPAPWENSSVLSGEASETVRDLKARHDKTLIVFGSGQLVRSLLEAGLLDRLLLMIHPVVLGDGLRLFDAAGLRNLTLVSGSTTPPGVLLATYRAR